MTTHWLTDDWNLWQVGERGFLSRVHHVTKGWTRHELSTRPCQTNQSREERFSGWCGTTNDVSVHACGIAQVIRVTKNGRIQVKELDGEPVDAFLNEAGYPNLR